MNIAIIGPTPPPNGGMAMQTQQLIRLVSDAGMSVTPIMTNGAYRPALVGGVPVLRAVFRLCCYFTTLMVQLRGVKVIHLMANSGWSFYLFSMPVIYIASWYKIPVVMNYRGGLAGDFFSGHWRWIKRSIARVDKIIVPSEFLRQVFQRYDVASTVVPNIIDLAVFEFHQVRLDPESLHIVVTRNLELIYDNETAIKGFSLFVKAHPNARLSIAGSGEQDKQLQKLVNQLDLNDKITFVGRLERNDIANLYRSADILLNTSLVDNTPNSIIEALACGLVVVSSDVGGIPHLVTDQKHAYLVPPSSSERVAQQLSYVLDKKELARNVALSGHQMVRQFTPQIVIPKLLDIYRELS